VDEWTLRKECPSGSGKSSWVEANGNGDIVVSLDQLREEIGGKLELQAKNGKVLQAAIEAVKVGLRQKKSVIFDATNTRVDGRNRFLDIGQAYGAYTRLICFKNSIPELLKRNLKRHHPIPSSVLEAQIDRMEWPFDNEAHEVVMVSS
jgi:predicted kinase